MPPPRPNQFDDPEPTNVERTDSSSEATAVTDPGPPPKPSLPSMPAGESVEAAPPTVLEMPLNTVEDMPAAKPKPLDPDDDPTTTRRGIPKQILEQRQQEEAKPRPPPSRVPPPRVPAPRVTASEVASVSALSPRKRHPLLAIGIALLGFMMALLALNWLMASPEPTADGSEPAVARLKRMFDW